MFLSGKAGDVSLDCGLNSGQWKLPTENAQIVL